MIFDVTAYGAIGNGKVDDAPAFKIALSALYAAKGGTLFIPFSSAGYALGSSIIVDPGKYSGGGGITVDLNGSTLLPYHTGWCLDFKTNFFGATNVGNKPVRLLGNGGQIWTENNAASGGVRFTDCVRFSVRDFSCGGYASGTGIECYISSTDQSTWCEFGNFSNITLWGNLTGFYAKCENPTWTPIGAGSFLGGYYEQITIGGGPSGSKLFNLEGSHTNAQFNSCGGYYDQNGASGSCGFYLNGAFQGCTFVSPWIDLGGGGVHNAATDIVIGPNYTPNAPQFPILVNAMWIKAPANWAQYLNILGPTMP